MTKSDLWNIDENNPGLFHTWPEETSLAVPSPSLFLCWLHAEDPKDPEDGGAMKGKENSSLNHHVGDPLLHTSSELSNEDGG